MTVISDSVSGTGSPRHPAQPSNYYPLATIKCVGRPIFRSQAARDFACLLDVDPDVLSWRPFADPLSDGTRVREVDFLVVTENATFIAEVGEEEPLSEAWITEYVSALGHRYRPVGMIELSQGFRLQNAKDLMRYGYYRATLGDRVRLLAALDEMGTLTLAECLSAIREAKPMASMAAMALHGFIEIEMDESPIGPETTVRRIRL
jgi:hypothetical protein